MSFGVTISGIATRAGNATAEVSCSRLCTVVSELSFTAANPTPLPSPSTSPISRIAGMLGLDGFSGSRAASTMVNRSPSCSFSSPWATLASIDFLLSSSDFACRLFRSATSVRYPSSTLGAASIRARKVSASPGGP